MEVSAGHFQLLELVSEVDGVLEEFDLPTFYKVRRFLLTSLPVWTCWLVPCEVFTQINRSQLQWLPCCAWKQGCPRIERALWE